MVYSTVDTYLTDEDFRRSINDPCMYFKPDCNIIILLWVDDILIAAQPAAMKTVKSVFGIRFQMKDLGEVSYFLGIRFERLKIEDIETITMSQSMYISKVLERFGKSDCKPRYKLTPIEMKPCVNEQDSEPHIGDEIKMYTVQTNCWCPHLYYDCYKT